MINAKCKMQMPDARYQMPDTRCRMPDASRKVTLIRSLSSLFSIGKKGGGPFFNKDNVTGECVSGKYAHLYFCVRAEWWWVVLLPLFFSSIEQL